MSKKYIAFANGNAASSGIQTHDEAIKWAHASLAAGKVNLIHVAEVIEIVERVSPPIEVRPYAPPEPSVPEPKFKAA